MRKRLFIFLFFFSLAHSVFPQLQNNDLVVVSKSGKKFTLYVNGEKINQAPEVNVKAFNISEGWYKLKAEFEGGQTIADSIRIKASSKNNNKEITYAIEENPGRFVFVHIGNLSGPQTPPIPESPVDKNPVIDNTIYGNLYQVIKEKPVFFLNYNDSLKKCGVELTETDIKHAINLIGKTSDFSDKFRYTEYTVDRNCYTVSNISPVIKLAAVELDKLKLAKRAFFHLTDKENAKKLTEIFSYKSITEDFMLFLKGVANAEHQKSLNCTTAVSDEKLAVIIQTIKKGQYEFDRLRIAREQTINNCLNSQQVGKLLQLFSHDRDKMDLAKQAYAIVIDKDNYKTLVEYFQFSENKKDFLNFLEK